MLVLLSVPWQFCNFANTHAEDSTKNVVLFIAFVPDSGKNQALLSLGMVERGKSTGILCFSPLEMSYWNTELHP